MTGWTLSFKTNVWYFPAVNEHWTIESHKQMSSMIKRPIPPICSVHIKKDKSAWNFYHNENLKLVQQKIHTLFMKEDFIKDFEKLMQRLSRKDKKLKDLHIRKKKVPFQTSMKVAIFGGSIFFITLPQYVKLIEDDIYALKNKYQLTDEEFSKLLEHTNITSELKYEYDLNYLSIKSNQQHISDKELLNFQEQYLYKDAVKNAIAKKDLVTPLNEIRKRVVNNFTSAQKLLKRNRFIRSLPHRRHKQKKDLCREKNISKKDEKAFAMYAKLTHYRLECRNLWITHYVHSSSIEQEILKRHSLPDDSIDTLTFEQCCEFYENGKILRAGLQPKKIIRLLHNNKTVIKYDHLAEKFIEHLNLPLTTTKSKVLTGKVSFKKGIIKGIARVMKWDKNIEQSMQKMQKGEILVIPQTKPDLMPAIQKAKAIVTDEGGLISHAAIISRELEIPCIIQTRHATDSIQTGDNIIVDTNKGEVRKVD